MYYFSWSVTNYYTLGALKQQKSFLSQLWRPESKIKVLAELVSPEIPQEDPCCLSPACKCIAPVSTFIVSPVCLCLLLLYGHQSLDLGPSMTSS